MNVLEVCDGGLSRLGALSVVPTIGIPEALRPAVEQLCVCSCSV
jgi:hypothetical protein